jgi:hypothetical protein
MKGSTFAPAILRCLALAARARRGSSCRRDIAPFPVPRGLRAASAAACARERQNGHRGRAGHESAGVPSRVWRGRARCGSRPGAIRPAGLPRRAEGRATLTCRAVAGPSPRLRRGHRRGPRGLAIGPDSTTRRDRMCVGRRAGRRTDVRRRTRWISRRVHGLPAPGRRAVACRSRAARASPSSAAVRRPDPDACGCARCRSRRGCHGRSHLTISRWDQRDARRAVFTVEVPSDAVPLTLGELRDARPLGRKWAGYRFTDFRLRFRVPDAEMRVPVPVLGCPPSSPFARSQISLSRRPSPDRRSFWLRTVYQTLALHDVCRSRAGEDVR